MGGTSTDADVSTLLLLLDPGFCSRSCFCFCCIALSAVISWSFDHTIATQILVLRGEFLFCLCLSSAVKTGRWGVSNRWWSLSSGTVCLYRLLASPRLWSGDTIGIYVAQFYRPLPTPKSDLMESFVWYFDIIVQPCRFLHRCNACIFVFMWFSFKSLAGEISTAHRQDPNLKDHRKVSKVQHDNRKPRPKPRTNIKTHQ